MAATTSEGTGNGSSEGPLRGFSLDYIHKVFIGPLTALKTCVRFINNKYILRISADDVTFNDSNVSFTAENAQEAIEALDAGGGGGSGSSTRRTILQPTHGFVSGSDIGAAIYLNPSGDWTKAQSDTAGTLGVALISEVIDTNNFEIITHGYLTGINVVPLTPNEYHFVSTTTAGELVSVEPTANGDYSNPLLLADSTSSGYVYAFRPNVINTATISTSFSGSFNNTTTGTPIDWNAGTDTLTVTHDLNQQYNHVAVYTDSGVLIDPDIVTATSTTVTTIDLSSFVIGLGFWNVTIST